MKINVLNKGDEVINVTQDFIAVRRKRGEVDIIPLVWEKEGMRVDIENIITIGFGNYEVVAEKNGITIMNF